MPALAPLAPIAAGAGGGTAAVGGGTALVGGLTATELVVLGVTAVAVAGYAVSGIIDDYLDEPTTESEVDNILDKAGERSKAESRRLRDCAECVWCQVNIQAQGSFVDPIGGRATSQGIGPYLVQGRTVYVREGIIIAGATHEFTKERAGRKNFKQIERWAILAKTIKYIQQQPPSGLAPGMSDYRPGTLKRYTSEIRYDIGVFGTINAFIQ